MDKTENYLEIDGNKVIAPTAERQAELDAAAGKGEDAFDISSPAKANESLRPGVLILIAHAFIHLVVTVFALQPLMPAITGNMLGFVELMFLAGTVLVPILISLGLAYAIYRHSRIASIASLVWAVILSISPVGLLFMGLALSALLPLLFQAAMVTTLAWATMANFAWHRFQSGDVPNPDVFN